MIPSGGISAGGTTSPSPSPSSSASSLQIAAHEQHHQRDKLQQKMAVDPPSPTPQYRLADMARALEDIVICIDADQQIDSHMKVTASKGHSLARLDAVKQAILLFVHSKLAMHPCHRFAFVALSHTVYWLQQSLTSDMEVINSSVRTFSSSGSFPQCDLSVLFQMGASMAKKSQAQGRILRVILIYCRSDVVPTYPSDWAQTQYPFTFDALYIHDKPSPTNCPQRVYDALVEALEKVSTAEGYIYESGTGLTRILFRQMCCLLAHPQQRIGQDDFEVPKDISKIGTVSDGNTNSASMKREDDGGGSNSFS